MMGAGIKVSVNSNTLNKNMTEFYFPQGTWCNLLKGNGTDTCLTAPDSGLAVTLPSKAYHSYAHLRNGYIIPFRDFNGTTVNDAVHATTFPTQLHINPTCFNGTCVASGHLTHDDGKVFDNTGLVNKVSFNYMTLDNKTLSLNIDMLLNSN